MKLASVCGAVVLALAGVAVGQTSKPVAVTYRGHAVTKGWVDANFARFANKISVVNGQYRDIGRDLLEKRLVGSEPPEVGSLRFCSKGKIDSVESDGSLMVVAGGTNIHIQGKFPGKVDGGGFDSPLVYVGTVKTDFGSTIQDYVIPTPLTRSEFEGALNSGFPLTLYRVVKEKRQVGASGGGFAVQNNTRMIEVDKIVATPVPVPGA
jgi:hypothetical protein